MITFQCNSCGRKFEVPDDYAGRRAKCKGCGSVVTVPGPTVGGTPARLSPRERRLRSDASQMLGAFEGFPSVKVRAIEGNPPERYEVEFAVKGLEDAAGGPRERNHHRVEIALSSEYPRVAPLCRMLTPVFHPNIGPAHVCVGDHWAAGERLVDLVIRIGEMIAYQAYNIKSPLNGEAAKWADLNREKLPVDARSLRPPGLE